MSKASDCYIPPLMVPSRGNKHVNVNVDGLPQFFDTKEISDIHTSEYFQSSNNLGILSAITDLAAWAHQDLLRSGIWDLQDVNNLKSIFYWINRQLVSTLKRCQWCSYYPS